MNTKYTALSKILNNKPLNGGTIFFALESKKNITCQIMTNIRKNLFVTEEDTKKCIFNLVKKSYVRSLFNKQIKLHKDIKLVFMLSSDNLAFYINKIFSIIPEINFLDSSIFNVEITKKLCKKFNFNDKNILLYKLLSTLASPMSIIIKMLKENRNNEQVLN